MKVPILDLSVNSEMEHSVLLDAAQSFSARYDNTLESSFGDIACFSFNSMNMYATIEEAGVIVKDDQKIKNRLISLHYPGFKKQA